MTFALKIFDVVFALSGDTAAVPDSPPGDGSVSYLSGYGVDYQLDLATDPSALPVGRQQFNQILQDATGAIQQMQQTGHTPWSTLLKPYPQYAVVIYSDGHVYESQITTNNSTPGADANWLIVDSSASTGTPDYVRLPSGRILQWGIIASGSARTITFPIAFPTEVYSIVSGNNATITSNAVSFNNLTITGVDVTSTIANDYFMVIGS